MLLKTSRSFSRSLQFGGHQYSLKTTGSGTFQLCLCKPQTAALYSSVVYQKWLWPGALNASVKAKEDPVCWRCTAVPSHWHCFVPCPGQPCSVPWLQGSAALAFCRSIAWPPGHCSATALLHLHCIYGLFSLLPKVPVAQQEREPVAELTGGGARAGCRLLV